MPDRYVNRGLNLLGYGLMALGGIAVINTLIYLRPEPSADSIMNANPIGPGLEQAYKERYYFENARTSINLTLEQGVRDPDYGNLTYVFKNGYLTSPPLVSVRGIGGLSIGVVFERSNSRGTRGALRIDSDRRDYPLFVMTQFTEVQPDQPNVLLLEWKKWAITRQLVDGVEAPSPKTPDLKSILSFNVKGY